MDAIDPAASWLIAAVVLGIAELVVPGIFLVFLAVAAAITGAAVFALPTLPLAAQLAAFAAWSVVTVLIGKRWYGDFPVEGGDPLLNDRASRLIGQVVTVDAAIVDGVGRVRVGDGSWPARGPDSERGQTLRVAAIRDGVLLVEPLSG